MALTPRDFTTIGQWAKNANVNIPPIPISGQSYRNDGVQPSIVEYGQAYDVIADSAVWNQIMYLISGMARESELYGIPRWSNLTDMYVPGALVLGSDGFPYRAILANGANVSGVGPKDPAATTGYWILFSEWIKQSITPSTYQIFYARKDGNDNNPGTADNPTEAFGTITGGINAIQRKQFASPYNVELRVGPGIYSESVVVNPSNISSSLFRIVGSGMDQTIIRPPIDTDGIYATGSGTIDVNNLEVNPTCNDGDPVRGMVTYGPIFHTSNCRVRGQLNGNGNLIALQGDSNGTMAPIGYTEITGSFSRLLVVSTGTFWFNLPGRSAFTISLINCNAPWCMVSESLGLATVLSNVTFLTNNSTIGARYYVANNSIIDVNGRGNNFFPGIADGTAIYGGIYKP